MNDHAITEAAEEIAKAEALLVAAGAGMGVDSGLPDFRGNQGFWRAYPPYEKLGLDFVSLANPRLFRSDPALAWGFYGHRMNLYRQTRPHDGFGILRAWASRMKHGAFVFTSNVDGHFQRAGFAEDRVVEIHGSVHWMQCTKDCGVGIFPVGPASRRSGPKTGETPVPPGGTGMTPVLPVVIDEESMRAQEPLPKCPECGALARPNILMFYDWDWDGSRTSIQQSRLNAWLREVGSSPMVIVECGAGTAIPTVRQFCEDVADEVCRTLVRINLHEASVPEGHIGMAMGALEGLRTIDERLESLSPSTP